MIDIIKFLTNAKSVQKEVNVIRESFSKREFVGDSGGGMVKVTIYGNGNVKNIKIDNSIIEPKEKQMLEDLIVTAFNNAKKKIEADFLSDFSKLGLPSTLLDLLKGVR